MEDVALLTPKVAIITRPGASSRRHEVLGIEASIHWHYDRVEHIVAPGTVEAGDIMMVGDHYYIGLSKRTNMAGAVQMISILQQYGLTGSTVRLDRMLHLKTGLAYLEHNFLLVAGEFIGHPDFKAFKQISVPDSEAYAANCIWVNDRVLVPAGYPITTHAIIQAGYEVKEVEVSEFQKLDGGLSCLSLRF